jgi:hypothetical protein
MDSRWPYGSADRPSLIVRQANAGTVELPGGRGGVAWRETQQVLLALTALHSDVDVVMAVRIVRSGSAGSAREVQSIDADAHLHIVALERESSASIRFGEPWGLATRPVATAGAPHGQRSVAFSGICAYERSKVPRHEPTPFATA